MPTYYGILMLHSTIKLFGDKSAQKYCLNDNLVELCSSRTERVELNTIMAKEDRKKTSYDVLFRKLYLAVMNIYGDQVLVTHALPHVFHPDILIFKQVREKDSFKSFNLKPNAYAGTVVVLQHTSHFSDSQNKITNGYFQHRVNLLTALGFKVVTVPWFEIVEFPIPRIIRKMSLAIDVPINNGK